MAQSVARAGGAADDRLLPLVALLYVSQGVPMGLSMEALPVLMRDAGVSLDIIAWVPLAGLPWILKLFWAPLVENRSSARLGRRRGWILWMQGLLALALITLGFLPLSGSGVWIALGVLTIGGIASATQDTATDGLVAESLSGASLARANAFQVGGMMAGYMIGGAGALVLSSVLGQITTMALLASVPLASLVMALGWREQPAVPRARARLIATFRRAGIWRMMALAVAFGGAHSAGLSLSRVLLIDKGWSVAETGIMATVSGLLLVIVGCPLGSRLASIDRYLTIAIGMGLAALSFALWALIGSGHLAAEWLAVGPATAALSMASGLIAVAAYTVLMAFAGQGDQAGTDATMLQSASVSGEMFIAGFAMWVAGSFGYGVSLGGAAIGVAVLALVVGLMARHG